MLTTIDGAVREIDVNSDAPSRARVVPPVIDRERVRILNQIKPMKRGFVHDRDQIQRAIRSLGVEVEVALCRVEIHDNVDCRSVRRKDPRHRDGGKPNRPAHEAD
jgi:hypothetical protein